MHKALLVCCSVVLLFSIVVSGAGKGKGKGRGQHGHSKGKGCGNNECSWKRNKNAEKTKNELSAHFKSFKEAEKFERVQDKLENFKRRAAERAGRTWTDEIADTAWIEKDQTELANNVEVQDFMFEGDIVPTEELLDQMNGEVRRVKRKVAEPSIFGSHIRWNGIVAYTLDSSIKESPDHFNAVLEGLIFWQLNTCLNFVEDADAEDKINFFIGSGCYSSIGRTTGEQGISIGYGCQYAGIVIHEIGHALGMFHEQSRSERDAFVTVNEGNINPMYIGNFDKQPAERLNPFDQPYDYGSVMHYGQWGFAIEKTIPTIYANDGQYQTTIGQRLEASFVDVAAINGAYQCASTCGSSIDCEHGGIQDSRNCDKCICPSGFGGPTCGGIEPSSDSSCGGVLEAVDNWSELDYSATATIKCVYQIVSTNPGIKAEIVPSSTFDFPCRDSGCRSGYMEVKYKSDFRQSGARSCCEAPTTEYVTSESIMILIARAADGYSTAFKLRYRAINAPVVTPPTTIAVQTTTTKAPEPDTCPRRRRDRWNPWSEWTVCEGAIQCGACSVKTKTRDCKFERADCPCRGRSERKRSCRRRKCSPGQIDASNPDVVCCEPFVLVRNRCKMPSTAYSAHPQFDED